MECEIREQSIKSPDFFQERTEEVIDITPERFNAFVKTCVGVRDYYWEYTPKSKLQKDKFSDAIYLSDKIIKEHLLGKKTLGLVPFCDTDIQSRNVYFLGIDIDAHGLTDGAKADLLKKFNGDKAKVKEYDDLAKAQQKLLVEEQYLRITTWLKQEGYAYFVNTSGSAGRHIRIYFNAPIDAKIGRAWLNYVFEEKLKLDITEIFPKQDCRADTPKKRGNQMKAVCAVHPKTGRRANILRADGSVMSVNETLDFLVEFAKKLPTAKSLDFELTEEREEKYTKDKKKSKEQYKEQPIPEYCEFLEKIAAKNQLPSEGKFNRHDYLDGAVFRYCEENNKPEVKEGYMTMQGRDKGAFNGAEKYSFACKPLRNYIKNYPNHPVLKNYQGMCDNCKYKQSFAEELTLQEAVLKKINNILDAKDMSMKLSELRTEFPKYKDLIKEISEAKSDEDVELIFDKWIDTLKTKKSKGVLLKILEGAKHWQEGSKPKKKKHRSIIFKNETNGSISVNILEEKTDIYGNIKITEKTLLFFSEIKIKNANHYDSTLNKITKKTIITLKRGNDIKNKIEYSVEDIFNWAAISCDILEKFSPESSWKMNLSIYNEELADFLQYDLSEELKDEITNIESTDLFGVFLIDGKLNIYHADNCEYHSKDNDEIAMAEVFDEEERLRNASDDTFVIQRWLNLVKSIPTDDYSRRVLYNYWAFELAAYLRCALFDLKIGIIPTVILAGEREEGKSHILMQPFLTYFYGLKISQNSQTFEGTGIRLKSVSIGTTRPQAIDEMKSFGEHNKLIDLIKNGATEKLGAVMKRGNRDLTMNNYQLVRPLSCGVNKINVDDSALRDRIYGIPINKGLRNKNKHLNEDELSFLHTNAVSVGRLYQNFIENHSDYILDNIKKIFKETQELAKKSVRDAAMERYLRIGLFLIKELYQKAGLTPPEHLDDVTVFAKSDVNMIVNESVENMQSVIWKIMREKHRISITVPDGDHKGTITDELSAYEVLQLYKKVDEKTPDNLNEKFKQMYRKLSANGIYFSSDKHEVLFVGDGFKAKYNEFNVKAPISSMKELFDALANLGWNPRYLGRDEKEMMVCGKRVSFAIALNHNQFRTESPEDKQNGLSS